MQKAIRLLRSNIEAVKDYFSSLSEQELSARPSPGKWSKKEILGHLTDSAMNNLQRFIRGQYENTPYIVYAQDEWVKLQHYHEKDSRGLLDLWESLNLQIAHVLEYMPKKNYDRECRSESVHTLHWLAEDYVRHMEHHMRQMGMDVLSEYGYYPKVV
jgi:hypothetical protein